MHRIFKNNNTIFTVEQVLDDGGNFLNNATGITLVLNQPGVPTPLATVTGTYVTSSNGFYIFDIPAQTASNIGTMLNAVCTFVLLSETVVITIPTRVELYTVPHGVGPSGLVSDNAVLNSDIGVTVDNFTKDNIAVVNPAVTDDSTAGYVIGSQWTNTNTDTIFQMVDSTSGAAVWADISSAATGSGEINTGSSIGTGGVSVFDNKVGVDLQFKNIISPNNSVNVIDNVGDNNVELTVNASSINHDSLFNYLASEHFTEASINHDALLSVGINTHGQIDSHLSSGAIHRTISDGAVSGIFLWSSFKINGEFNLKSDIGHTHTESDITDLQAYLTNITGESISTLSDVTLASPLSGQVLTYNGSVWENVAPVSGLTDHLLLSNIGTNSHSQIDTALSNSSAHIADGSLHRVINDGGVSTTELFSASKIISDLSGKANSVHNQDAATINSGTFADARIASSNVTQHQASIIITESQISDLSHFETLPSLTDVTLSTPLSGQVLTYNGSVWQNVAPVSGVTDHLLLSNIGSNSHAQLDTGLSNSVAHIADGSVHRTINDAGISTTELFSASKIISDLSGKSNTVHTHSTTDITSGTFADARIASSNVTQHQSLLTLTESQISDLSHFETLPSLTDVTLASPISGQVLTYNGTIWENVAPVSGVTDHLLLSNIGTNSHAQIDTAIIASQNHQAASALHRVINDGGVSTTELFSASKIISDLSGKANSVHTHVVADITDISTNYQPLDSDLTTIAALPQSKGQVLVSDGTNWVSVGVGADTEVLTANSAISAGIEWSAAGAGGGEVNTASSPSLSGVDVFKQKIGVDLEFKSLVPTGANTILITDDFPNSRIFLSTIDGNINHDALQNYSVTEHFTVASINHDLIQNVGANSHADIDILLANSSAHIANLNNPHGVNKADVGLSNVDNDRLTIYKPAGTPLVTDDETDGFTIGSTMVIGTGAERTTYTAVDVTTNAAVWTRILDENSIEDGVGTTTGVWSSAYLTNEFIMKADFAHNQSAGTITSGTFADARIQESNVTQHQAAITITESQISDLTHTPAYTPLVINPEVGTAYTLVLADGGNMVEMNNAAANIVTVPTNASVAFDIGTEIVIQQLGVGQTTIAGPGITFQSAGGLLSLNEQYSGLTLIKKATDTWAIIGDMV